LSHFRNTIAARVERAERRLDELRHERQAFERRYRDACAALEGLVSARAPELPPIPVPLGLQRRRPLVAWGCVGGLLAVFVLFVLAH
jgi:hypothetical protein